MRLTTLLSKITLIFVVAFLLLIGHFIIFSKIEDKRKHRHVVHEYRNLSHYFHRNRMPKHEVIEYVKELGFSLESNHKEVLRKGKIIFDKRGLEVIFYKNNYYLHLLTRNFRVLFKDSKSYNEDFKFAWILFGSLFLFLVGMYVWLIRSLKPLSQLKEKITQFASGDMQVDCKSSKKDEIADVANEFDNAVGQIRLLLNSRQLFLRTVMHELKTPVAKGRIVSELIVDEKQKKRMVTIFEKLDFMINHFAKIEQVVTKNYNISKGNFSLQTILDEAVAMLLIENSQNIHIDLSKNQMMNVDLELMALVFKNLMDNALKYSDDKKVIIQEKENTLCFISKGEVLPKPIEEYFKPFHNDTQDKNHGMGLGLYIVNSILKMHHMQLHYHHEQNSNVFEILISSEIK